MRPRPRAASYGKSVQNADSVAVFVMAVTHGIDSVLSRIGGVTYEDRVSKDFKTKEGPLLAKLSVL